ncbi:MAG: hypothetical protein JWR38_501 [Mucilaginibacter sp.]|nr:hypothetical protein [Mucilaginibacter sp.]
MTPEKKDEIKKKVVDSLKDQLKQLSENPSKELVGGFASKAIDSALNAIDSGALDDTNYLFCTTHHNHVKGCGHIIDGANNDS